MATAMMPVVEGVRRNVDEMLSSKEAPHVALKQWISKPRVLPRLQPCARPNLHHSFIFTNT